MVKEGDMRLTVINDISITIINESIDVFSFPKIASIRPTSTIHTPRTTRAEATKPAIHVTSVDRKTLQSKQFLLNKTLARKRRTEHNAAWSNIERVDKTPAYGHTIAAPHTNIGGVGIVLYFASVDTLKCIVT